MKNSKSETILMVQQLLSDIMSLFDRVRPDNKFILDEDPEGGIYCIVSKAVTLYFYETEAKFFMSFRVGTSAQQAAEITKLIDLILKYDEYVVLDDSFYDKNEQRVVYGLEAYEKQGELIRKIKGQMKCPICEGVYNKKHFVDGYCKNCVSLVPDIKWI